jgi:hypothetical protein
MSELLLIYTLTKTTRRLTFDILAQKRRVTNLLPEGNPRLQFKARNGYEVISDSRMDIQTERIWLLGARSADEMRSGSMVFSSNERRDAAYLQFVDALDQWAAFYLGFALHVSVEQDPAGYTDSKGSVWL